jgi:hypothetical protein
MLDGWTVLRFAFDDIADKPRQCQQMLLQLHGKLIAVGRGGRTGEIEYS